MWSTDAPFDETQRRRVRELIDQSYRLFLERVAASRGRTPEEIEPVAGGRVWTGRQAWERGLVDELGGLERAAAEARQLAGLPAQAPMREARGGRRDLAPMAAGAPAVLEHALHAALALNQAATWWLCPLVSSEPR
jgi:protease-4